MRFEKFSFGSICIDGVTYGHVSSAGRFASLRKLSKKFREAFVTRSAVRGGEASVRNAAAA